MSKHIVIDARIRRSSTGRYADRLIEYLQKIDQSNHYTILLEYGDTWKPAADNFTVKHVPFKQFSLNPIEQFGFARVLRNLKPDVVHFSMTQQPLFYFGNIVTTTHDLGMLEFTRPGKTPVPIFWVKRALYRFLMWWAHRKSKVIIVPTEYVKKAVAKHHPFARKKLSVTYEASERVLPGLATPPIPTPKRPFLLYVGTAFPHKNLERLVAAFAILLQNHRGLSLVMAGKKEQYYHKLEEYIDGYETAKERIHMPGFVSDQELKWLYTHAAVYVFPSLNEGFGLPGLEAMSHGCPVAASKASCLPEVYRDGALYFDPQNPADMAKQIGALLSDNQLQKELVKKGEAVASSYSWEKMAHQTLDIYERV